LRADLRRHLVAYDVPNDRRRQRIARVLSSYGDRIQYSVFIVDTTPAKLARLQRSLESLMASDEDSVVICDLGRREGAHRDERLVCLGRSRAVTEASSFLM
jgi:CRISPR-associated protein Cas2